MFRLFETVSSAFAAASVLALALGCAIISNPSRADEPLIPILNCGLCTQGCNECTGEGACATADKEGCGCNCEVEQCGLCFGYCFSCVAPL